MSQWFFFRICFDHSEDREDSMRIEIFMGSTENPPLSLRRGAYLFQTHLRGCLIETEGLFERGKAYLI